MCEARRTSSAELDQSELDDWRSCRLAGPEIKSELQDDVTSGYLTDDILPPRYANMGKVVFYCLLAGI